MENKNPKVRDMSTGFVLYMNKLIFIHIRCLVVKPPLFNLLAAFIIHHCPFTFVLLLFYAWHTPWLSYQFIHVCSALVTICFPQINVEWFFNAISWHRIWNPIYISTIELLKALENYTGKNLKGVKVPRYLHIETK